MSYSSESVKSKLYESSKESSDVSSSCLGPSDFDQDISSWMMTPLIIKNIRKSETPGVVKGVVEFNQDAEEDAYISQVFKDDTAVKQKAKHNREQRMLSAVNEEEIGSID